MHVATNDPAAARPDGRLVRLDAPAPPGAASPGAADARPGLAADAIGPAWFGGASARSAAADPGGGNPFAGDGGILGLIGNLLDAAQSALAAVLAGLSAAPGANGGTRAFQDAEVDSVGDPHLSVTGTERRGDGSAAGTYADHFDSMTSHADLVDANATIPGGYQVSTTTTPMGTSGITSNQSATVTADNGDDTITFDRNGNSSILSNGRPVTIAAGQTVALAGGETVTGNADGSLTVNASDGHGGTIATTLSSNGSGVDVRTRAHDAILGGDAVDHNVTDPGALTAAAPQRRFTR